jgi:hypothetical protein
MSLENKNPNWKKFEKLVAALHIAEQKGAVIKWNDEIDGRQFDVTIRFKNGFYDYLTVIECKDYKKPVAVEKVDALATKSRDAKADKAVMVSASGFQKGAIKVAQKHNISLFTLKSLSSTSSSKIAQSFSPILLVYFIRFNVEAKNECVAIPEETGVMRSLMRDIKIIVEHNEICPEEIISNHRNDITELATCIPQTYEILFPPKTIMIPPNTLKRDNISALLLDFCLISENQLIKKPNVGIDNYLSEDIYEFVDELKGKTNVIDSSKYELGFDTVLEEGKFYKNPHLDFSYYCKSVGKTEAELCLVESYQFDQLFQLTFLIDFERGKISQFVEVTDKGEISRLKELYKE